jgi:hypothetical protein
MSIDIGPTLTDPTLTGPTLTGIKHPRKRKMIGMTNIFYYVEHTQNRKQKEITAILEAISEARDEFEMPEVISEDDNTQSYPYDNPKRIRPHPDAFEASSSSPSLNLDRGRLETISVVRCHGDILSPMSIFFNNPALEHLKPLMENTRLIVSGGYPGLTVVSQGICGQNSRLGGCVTVQNTTRAVVENCQYTGTIENFYIIVEAAKRYGAVNKTVNFDALIDARVNQDDILVEYNQTNLVHCLYFSADPERARLKLLEVLTETTGNTKIDDTVNDSEIEKTMRILDPYYEAGNFSACAISSVTDQTQEITLIYNNETDENDIFDINNLRFYRKLKYFFKKDDADKMRPFVLKLQLWVHKFIMEWNRLIFYYVENTQELYGDIHFLLKLENLVVVMDTNKQTITYSNTFVQNILIMGFGKWLFCVYQYLQNQNQNKEFMTEFMSIFDSNSNSSNSNTNFDNNKYVNFCEKISNLLLNRENVVKVIGNFCQGYNKRVYPDTNDIDLKEYIAQQKRTIETLWISGKTKTLADYTSGKQSNLDDNYKTAAKEKVSADNSNTYLGNINNSNNSNPYQEISSNSNTYPGNPYLGNSNNSNISNSNNIRWGGKPKSKKQRRQSKKQRRQSKKQRRQSKKQRRQGNKRNKYTVKRRR